MKRGELTGRGRSRRHEPGFVTVIILILVVLASLYVAANMRVLATLRGELELLDRKSTVSEPCDPEPTP